MNLRVWVQIHVVNVGVREWMWLNLCGSTCESVCVAAHIHVNVGVREWSWLNVCESACEFVCVGANVHVNVGVRERV